MKRIAMEVLRDVPALVRMERNTKQGCRILSLCIVLAGSAAAMGDILLDGNMDELTIGTNPDNYVPAGNWAFPPYYLPALGETADTQMTVVATSSFDPGAAGNSLHLDAADSAANVHLPHIFTQPILETPGEFTRVMFDIWVNAGTNGGGAVYVGKGGSTTDRGPQLLWFADNSIRAVIVGGVQTPIVTNYPRDAWQTVQLDIDLNTDRYDMFWGPRGGPLAHVANHVEFRSGPLGQLDRFTYVHFGSTIPFARSSIDNVSVVVIPEPTTLCMLVLAALHARGRRG